MKPNEETHSTFETNSQRYGNDKTVEDVFETQTYPKPDELQTALANTAHLTEREAFAFVHEGVPCRNSAVTSLHGESVKEQRVAVLEEVEDLVQKAEQDVGRELAYIRRNIHLAERDLLDDGEYNYLVRLALTQLEESVDRDDGVGYEISESIEEMSETLAEKAVLPPQGMVSR